MKKKILIPMFLLGLSVVSSCGENIEINNDSTPSVESTPSTESTSESKSESTSESTSSTTSESESSSSTPSETHTHEYVTDWSNDASKHWHADTCGHDTKKDVAEHTYSDWTVVKAATTSEEGLEKRECSVCGHVESRTIPVKVLDLSNYEYEKNGSDITITKYLGTDTEVVIPEGVTSIDSVFYNCRNLTSVTIPSSVTSIEPTAFQHCYRLVEVINKSSLNITKGSNDFGQIGYYALEVKNSGESSIVNKDGYLFYTVDNVNYLVGYTKIEEEIVLPNDYNGESYVINDYAFDNFYYLISVYYKGSKTEWENLSIGECNDYLMFATIYYYSEEEPTDTTNNYWHYVDGVITKW